MSEETGTTQTTAPDQTTTSTTTATPSGQGADAPWKALGYESFDAYAKARDEREQKLQAMADANQQMIQRQGTEIGELRKKVAAEEGTKPVETQTQTPTQTTQPAPTVDYGEKLRTLTLKMTDDERKAVLAKAKEVVEMDPQIAQNLESGGEKARFELLSAIYEPPIERTLEDKLFGSKEQERPLTHQERIQKALAQKSPLTSRGDAFRPGGGFTGTSQKTDLPADYGVLPLVERVKQRMERAG